MTSNRLQLESRLRSEVDAASRRFLADPKADVSEHLKRIETYTRLLSAQSSGSDDTKIWAVGVVLSCLLVISLLAVTRIGDTRLLLDVATTSAAFQLADALDWSDHVQLVAKALRVDGLSSVDARFFRPPIASQQHDAWVSIDAGGAALARLRMAESGIVQLEHTGGRRFAISLRQSELSGELQVLGEVTLGVGRTGGGSEESHRSLAVPEMISFSRRGEGIVPVTVQATFGEDWFLKDLPLRTLSVNREVPGEPGTATLVSSLKSGTILLPDVSRQVTLRERDHLTLDGVSGLLVEARLDGDGVRLIFQGEADEIRLGPTGFSQDLVPTYLEYLYHSQPLALFWGGASFLGGILWGIRRTLFA